MTIIEILCDYDNKKKYYGTIGRFEPTQPLY